MSEKIIVPTLGESVTEATVSKWLKSEGEKVGPDEPLVELETDKVNVEVPSPSKGILEKITVQEGQTVEVGAILGSIGASAIQSTENDEVKKYTPPKKPEVKEEKKEIEIPVFEKPIQEEIKDTKIKSIPILVLTGADLDDNDKSFLKNETEKVIHKTDDTVLSIAEEINNVIKRTG